MEWYSSDQYRMHEKQWYDNADEWEGVEEEPCQAPVQVKTEDDASSGKGEWKGKSSAPASGSKGKVCAVVIVPWVAPEVWPS